MRNLRLAFLLCAGVWLSLLVAGRTLVTRDLGATHLPWRAEWARQVTSGWLPLWNPKANGGRPFWADPNAQAAYPGTLLFLLLPTWQAMVLFLACHHLWLMAGLAFFARKTGVSEQAAWGSALLLGTAGVAFSLTTFPNALAAFSWLPWALSLLLTAAGSSGFSGTRALGAGGLLGMSFLAGEPVTSGLGLAVAAALLLAERRFVREFGWVLLGFLTVALPVLLPLLAVFPETVRGSLGVSPQALAADCLAPRRFVELFFPRLLGAPLGDATSGFWAAPSFPWQRYYPLLFLGGGTTVLLWLGSRCGQRQRLWSWVLVLGVVLALIPAWSVLTHVLLRLPGGQLARFAIKALQLSLLAAVPLVACGLEVLGKRHRRMKWGLVAAALAFLLPALFPETCRSVLAALYPASASSLQHIPASSLRSWLLLDGLTNAVPLLALAFCHSTVPMVFAFLAAHWPLFFATHVLSPQELWAKPPAAARALPPGAAVVSWAQAAGPATTPREKTLGFRNALVPDYGMAYGLSYLLARGPDGLEPIRGELLAAFAHQLEAQQKVRLAAALGAQALVLDAGAPSPHCRGVEAVVVCQPRQVAPAVYVARTVFPAENLEQAVAWLTAESFVPGADAALEGIAAPQSTGGGQVREEPGPPHRRRFQVQAPQRTWLVVQQNYLSSWKASVDGQPAQVVPANFARLAIPVPAGHHRVELRLEDRPYLLGALGPVVFFLMALYLRNAAQRVPSDAPERNNRARGPEP